MNKSFVIIIAFVFLSLNILAQKISISGYVLDENSGEKLIGVIVYENENNAVITNEFGFYSLKIEAGKALKVKCKYLGYQENEKTFNSTKNVTFNFSLVSNASVSAVTVYGTKRQDMDSYSFSTERIKRLPSLTGEKDVLKILQLMPGIQFGNEGTSNIYVRGGTPDQNLILVDDVPMHFVNHLGSFVSIFDINAVNKITLIKNGFPAKYGGHLSSVIDIRLKDGNMEKTEGEFSIGIISSKISLNGPIIKNKLSYVFTLRHSNFEIITYPYSYISKEPFLNNYGFYDLNAKINLIISDKDKIDFSIYSGSDKNIMRMDETEIMPNRYNFKFISDYENAWGNFLTSFRWTHSYNNNLFQKFVLGYTRYNYGKNNSYLAKNKITDSIESYGAMNYKTEIKDIVAKLDYEYFINSHNKLNFGISSIFHQYNPGDFSTEYWKKGTVDTVYNSKSEILLKPIDLDLYTDYNINFNKLSANFGLRMNIYFLNGEIWKNFQPRFKVLFKPTSNNHISFSYDRMYQNIHVLTMSNSIIPADIWVPATNIAQPESSNQFSLRYSHIFNNKYSFGVSVFYKTLQNVIEYKRFFSISDTVENPTWEQQIETGGKGEIYGLEFLLEKTQGKFTGWISYTYMHNTRTFENLNNGLPFAFNYDRRHNLKLVGQYNFTDEISLNAVFMFGSAYPISLPIIKQNYVDIIEGSDFSGGSSWPILVDENVNNVSNYTFDNITYVFDEINAYRMPAYHRLDLSLSMSKEMKRGTRTWSFNIYNVYNQKNPYYLMLGYDDVYYDGKLITELVLYKITLFPFIPSFSYSFKF